MEEGGLVGVGRGSSLKIFEKYFECFFFSLPRQRESKSDNVVNLRKITNKKARPLGELPTQGG